MLFLGIFPWLYHIALGHFCGGVFMYYDSTIILLLPGLLLGLWAQFQVKMAFSKYAKVRTRRGLAADAVARELLSRSGNPNVAITPIQGNLTDHYDPRSNTLSLSQEVFGSDSIAAVGIAAHECGHAMQDADGYGPLKLRSAIVPVVNIGSNLYFPIFLAGILFSWEPLVTLGIACFALTLLFSLITLPVELNASRRAVAALSQGGYVDEEELKGVKAVLRGAALTYVAAAISSLLQMIRLLMISRRRD
ncbi:MAG: zinc metallopeptidase [Clostridiales bacterium]|nr:zinc metallopeptidase [Clostridiales bacterium]